MSPGPPTPRGEHSSARHQEIANAACAGKRPAEVDRNQARIRDRAVHDQHSLIDRPGRGEAGRAGKRPGARPGFFDAAKSMILRSQRRCVERAVCCAAEPQQVGAGPTTFPRIVEPARSSSMLAPPVKSMASARVTPWRKSRRKSRHCDNGQPCADHAWAAYARRTTKTLVHAEPLSR